jgi:hypothetical protein
MSSHLILATSLALFVAACGVNEQTHVNALTMNACEPNSSYMPLVHGNGNGSGSGGNGQCQGTSNGDNCDDLHSGKIDCVGDGNSGQGDDKRHNCMFPQPGCDDQGCCDGDIVEPPSEPILQ